MRQAGKVLVLPGFQLSPAGAAQALENAPNKGVDADVAVMQAAIDIVTAGVCRLGNQGGSGSQCQMECRWSQMPSIHGAACHSTMQ